MPTLDAVRRALGAKAWREIGDHTASYTDDPFDVLWYAWTSLGREKADAAEQALTAYETAAVAGESPTEGAAAAIDSLRSSGHTFDHRQQQAALVGDAITDVQAARAAGTAAIAYAHKPGKGRALRSFQPDALIMSMNEIAHAL